MNAVAQKYAKKKVNTTRLALKKQELLNRLDVINQKTLQAQAKLKLAQEKKHKEKSRRNMRNSLSKVGVFTVLRSQTQIVFI